MALTLGHSGQGGQQQYPLWLVVMLHTLLLSLGFVRLSDWLQLREGRTEKWESDERLMENKHLAYDTLKKKKIYPQVHRFFFSIMVPSFGTGITEISYNATE